MSDRSIHTAEIQFLKHLLDNPYNLDACEKSFFITDIAYDLFQAMKSLYSREIPLTDEHVYSELVKSQPHVEKTLFTKIHEVNTEDDDKSFEFYHKRVQEEFYKAHLTENIIPQSLSNLSKKGEINVEAIEDLMEHLEDARAIALGEGKLKSYTGKEAIQHYRDHVEDSVYNPDKYATGDYYLDEAGVEFLEGEMTMIFSNSGSGKSTLVQNILEGRMLHGMPFSWYITEMGMVSTMNRVSASTSGFTKNVFKPKEIDGEYVVNDEALKHLNKMIRKYGSKNSWTLVPCNDQVLTLDALDEDIPVQKKKLGLKKKDPMLICIDLLSMIPELNGEPKTIEAGINRLAFIIKKHNVHLLGVIQAKEKRGHNITVKKLNDALKYRPVLEDIKNSSAFTERSRTILMSFRPMNIINKFDNLKDDPLVDLVEDVMYLTMLKANNDQEGKMLYYHFDGATASVTPYPEFGGWSSQFDVLDEEDGSEEDKKESKEEETAC